MSWRKPNARDGGYAEVTKDPQRPGSCDICGRYEMEPSRPGLDWSPPVGQAPDTLSGARPTVCAVEVSTVARRKGSRSGELIENPPIDFRGAARRSATANSRAWRARNAQASSASLEKRRFATTVATITTRPFRTTPVKNGLGAFDMRDRAGRGHRQPHRRIGVIVEEARRRYAEGLGKPLRELEAGGTALHDGGRDAKLIATCAGHSRQRPANLSTRLR